LFLHDVVKNFVHSSDEQTHVSISTVCSKYLYSLDNVLFVAVLTFPSSNLFLHDAVKNFVHSSDEQTHVSINTVCSKY
jgi:hypothetical protein